MQLWFSVGTARWSIFLVVGLPRANRDYAFDFSATSISRAPYSDYMLANSPHASPPIAQDSLKCLPDCQCRCHSSLMASLVPIWLASYIGHVFVSKQLIYPPWSTWSLCTVQTCRGDAQRMMAITWLLPHTQLLSGLTVTLNMTKRRIHFSLATANIIPYSSPVFKAIYDTDLHTLRDLFCRRTASIWDADIDGRTMFWVGLFLGSLFLIVWTQL